MLVFLKAPRPGLVKTRLAQAVGDTRATEIYRELAGSQLRRVPRGWPVEIHYAPRGARADMRSWLGSRWPLRVQRPGDLGARLSAAFARAFAGGASQVLAIGADCPGLDEAHLVAAARALARSDVALGPARDGGYYLIGLGRPEPALFSEIPWSTPDVVRLTRQRARIAGLRVRMLDALEDIDDIESWRRWQARAQRGRG